MRYIVRGILPDSLAVALQGINSFVIIELLCKTREEAESVLEARKYVYKDLSIREEPTDLIIKPELPL